MWGYSWRFSSGASISTPLRLRCGPCGVSKIPQLLNAIIAHVVGLGATLRLAHRVGVVCRAFALHCVSIGRQHPARWQGDSIFAQGSTSRRVCGVVAQAMRFCAEASTGYPAARSVGVERERCAGATFQYRQSADERGCFEQALGRIGAFWGPVSGIVSLALGVGAARMSLLRSIESPKASKWPQPRQVGRDIRRCCRVTLDPRPPPEQCVVSETDRGPFIANESRVPPEARSSRRSLAHIHVLRKTAYLRSDVMQRAQTWRGHAFVGLAGRLPRPSVATRRC